MMLSFQIVVGKESVSLPVPEVFAALSAALPIVTRVFSGNPYAVVSAHEVHKLVGGTYRYQKWLASVVSNCRIEEGFDKFTVDLIPDALNNLDAIKRGRGVQTFLSLKAARKVIVFSGKDESHLLYDYIDAAANAVTPYLLAKLEEAKKETAHERRLSLANEAVALSAVKKAGGSSITMFEHHQSIEKVSIANANKAARSHRAALFMWETAHEAQRALERGDAPRGLKFLKEIGEKYGPYSDFGRMDQEWE